MPTIWSRACVLSVALLLIACPAWAEAVFTSDVENDGTWVNGGGFWSTHNYGGLLNPYPLVGTVAWGGDGGDQNDYTTANTQLPVQPGTYTITGNVGNWSNRPFPTTVFNIRAGGTNHNLEPYLASASTPTPASGAWETWTKTYSIPVDAPVIGQDLTSVFWLPSGASPAGNAALDGPYNIDYTPPPGAVTVFSSDVENDGTWVNGGGFWSTHNYGGLLNPYPQVGAVAWGGDGGGQNDYATADTGVQLAAGFYTVTGTVGNWSNFPFPETMFNIRAGGANFNLEQYLIESITPTPESGGWETWTKTYEIPLTAPELGGDLIAVFWLPNWGTPAGNAALDGPYTITWSADPIPEPATLTLLALGGLGLLARRRKRR